MHELIIDGLRAGVAGREILKGVDLVVRSGEVHAVMGPNGSGKSTLSHVLAGKPGYEVLGGQATLDGVDLLAMPAYERAHAGLFLASQYPIEVPGVFLRDVLREALVAAGRSVDDLDALVRDEAAAIGFDERFVDRPLNVDLSGGEKKRNETLQLGVLDPKIAVLDELDSGLDVDALRAVSRRIEAVTDSDGLGVLAITHYRRLLTELRPDRVHVLAGGRIAASGGPDLARELETTGYADYAETEPAASGRRPLRRSARLTRPRRGPAPRCVRPQTQNHPRVLDVTPPGVVRCVATRGPHITLPLRGERMSLASVHDATTVTALLAPGGVSAAFQPIVDLGDHSIPAWEALGRTRGGEPLAPDVALAMAERVGRSADLEVAFWDAVVAAGPPPGGALLFVNLGGTALTDPRVVDRLDVVPAYVVIEITEQIVAAGEAELAESVAQWSAVGVRFAVDDIGAGYSSLRRVLDLEPAYLKLDTSLVQGLAHDARLRAALTAMTTFAQAVDAQLVAEGVERAEDLAVLIDSGVRLAQGFLLGRPGPPWTLPGPTVLDLRD